MTRFGQVRWPGWVRAFAVAVLAAVVGLLATGPASADPAPNRVTSVYDEPAGLSKTSASAAPLIYTYDTTPYAYDAPGRSSTQDPAVTSASGALAGPVAASPGPCVSLAWFGVAANSAAASSGLPHRLVTIHLARFSGLACKKVAAPSSYHFKFRGDAVPVSLM